MDWIIDCWGLGMTKAILTGAEIILVLTTIPQVKVAFFSVCLIITYSIIGQIPIWTARYWFFRFFIPCDWSWRSAFNVNYDHDYCCTDYADNVEKQSSTCLVGFPLWSDFSIDPERNVYGNVWWWLKVALPQLWPVLCKKLYWLHFPFAYSSHLSKKISLQFVSKLNLLPDIYL